MERPSGCSLPRSTEPANLMSSSCSLFTIHCPCTTESVISGLPLVIVPVLSKMTIFTSLKVWIASPERIRMPFSAPLPLPTINAVGVAKPRAQGQAMTSTDTIDTIANVSTPRSGFTQGRKVPALTSVFIKTGKTTQARTVNAAMAITIGTKTPVTLSANSWMGTLEPWHSSTSLIT